MAADHPLHRQPVVVIATSEASDDIIVALPGARWARVHLTWRNKAETPPWPRTRFYDTVDDLQRHLDESD
ncbi:hypothetical protein E1211_08895 [Micromonospora sp. 15K316]|nr:hypothetical protein E1211_08895 [Micromonospora sp. 15K316]